MRSLTASQKRAVASAVEPALSLAYRAYRLLRAGRRGSGRIDLSDPDAAATVRKVLVVRLDAIGDLLLSEPALEVLRLRYPQARIDLVANPASAAVLQGNPNFDRLLRYRAPWHATWRGASVDWRLEAARFGGLTRTLRREQYDLGFELRGDVRDIVFLAAAGPKTLVRSGVRGGAGLLDWNAPQPPDAHQVELAVAIASAGGTQAVPRPPRVHLADDERSKAAALLPATEGSVPIGLHLGAGFQSKCLPMEKFVALMAALHQLSATRQFVVVGAPEERPLIETLKAQLEACSLSQAIHLTDLVGKLSLLETAAILERCLLFIGNDSAPMHLAAAVGTPVVTFFGPSEPWKFHPYGVAYRLLEVDLTCRPCDYVHCLWPEPLRYQCMTRQSVDALVAAAEELLRA